VTFAARLDACVDATGSLLCAGLDPDGFATAAEAERRCLEIVDATMEHVCAFKPNLAFFEQFGSAGGAILQRPRQAGPASRRAARRQSRPEPRQHRRAHGRTQTGGRINST